jgi:hypothetical protein
LLDQHAAGFHIWDEKNVRLPGNRGYDPFALRTFWGQSDPELQGAIDIASSNLSAIGHFA